MKVDSGIGGDLARVPEQAAALEKAGMNGLMTAETAHDPFFPLLMAAQSTEKIDLMTSIAVAFARTPMVLANVGHDLNQFSKGRFVLGLGSQIKPHITKRFSMPWSSPAARMREFIMAMRAIWANWHDQQPLEFTGKYYTHTLMTPFFTPTNVEYGAPRVFLAAVGPKMTEVAGEVADGMIVHAFTTETYLRETTLPALTKGWEKAGKRREDFEIMYPLFVVTGGTEEAMAASAVAAKRQIAFYGSTPAYKPVLESIGVGDMQGELNTMSKQGRWQEMGELITDDILESFAVVAEPDQVADQIISRYGDIVDRTSAAYGGIPAEQQAEIISKLTAA
ncbi:MAG: LLM class F420-dependent oxidoreductase [Gammaproteobacteria bacterium]|nr:LLM class F420-dependent oxidoreductase [Gammaproteobacteria bacterium]MCH2567590.1 TIGR03617 family F420-dependent LLM class oxidoreductase [Pseudomonadales bacterium]MEE2914194.1 TIGR03617 family F420-dependent LLM class oxidoreductase [Pseudomonadota bacterium]OUU07840.1 MAG: LLM class F420-dependent oxidoreductase [Gammaproteobacteria bacterium TMED34]